VTVCRPPFIVLVGWTALTVLMLAASQVRTQEVQNWKTGAAFRQQLNQSEGISWQQRPLREGLARLSAAYGVAIFLDRRIDPETPITLALRDRPLASLLNHIARSADAEMSLIGSVVYIGPPQTASQLATLAAIRKQEISTSSAEVKSNLLRPAAWQWEELAQPRQLLDELARLAAVRVQNPEVIPLDLWPAVRLPPLTWSDRMTLLLAGFGLTFEIDSRGQSLQLITAPANALLEKRYSPRGPAIDLAAQLRQLLPQTTVRVDQGQVLVGARAEDHERVEQLLSGQSVRTSKTVKAGSQKVYTLKVENESAGNVVKTVAGYLGKELKFEPTLFEKLKQQVNLNVKDVTAEQLLESTLKPIGLTFRLSDTTLEVSEAK
jgi:hypothetical protein